MNITLDPAGSTKVTDQDQTDEVFNLWNWEGVPFYDTDVDDTDVYQHCSIQKHILPK